MSGLAARNEPGRVPGRRGHAVMWRITPAGGYLAGISGTDRPPRCHGCPGSASTCPWSPRGHWQDDSVPRRPGPPGTGGRCRSQQEPAARSGGSGRVARPPASRTAFCPEPPAITPIGASGDIGGDRLAFW